MARKQDELDGLINCLQLNDNLLIKKAFSENQKQVVHSVEPETAPSPELSALNRGAGWDELLLMADQGSWSRPAEPSRDGRSGKLIGPRFLLPWMLRTRWLRPQLG